MADATFGGCEFPGATLRPCKAWRRPVLWSQPPARHFETVWKVTLDQSGGCEYRPPLLVQSGGCRAVSTGRTCRDPVKWCDHEKKFAHPQPPLRTNVAAVCMAACCAGYTCCDVQAETCLPGRACDGPLNIGNLRSGIKPLNSGLNFFGGCEALFGRVD